MPAPSSSLATLRPDLGGSMEEFSLAMDRAGFVALQLLPVFETRKQSGPFGIIPIEELLKNRETRRSPGGSYNRSSWKFDTASFATEENGWEEPVDDREAEMYREYFDAEVVSAEIARDVVARNLEKRVAALVQGAAITATGAGSDWSDPENATPMADVETAVRAIYAASGLWPDTLQVSRLGFRNLRNCAEIIDRVKYSGFDDVKPEKITASMLAQCFDLRRVVVAGGTMLTNAEGQAATPGGIWDEDKALVCRVASSNSIKEPCLGRILHWGEDGSIIGGTMETYRDETVRGEVVRCRMDTDEKLLHPQAAYRLTGLTG